MALLFISSIINDALRSRTNNIYCIHPLRYNQAIKDTDSATSLSVCVFLLQRYAVVPRVSKILIAKTWLLTTSRAPSQQRLRSIANCSTMYFATQHILFGTRNFSFTARFSANYRHKNTSSRLIHPPPT
jgi:hypothetical protein